MNLGDALLIEALGWCGFFAGAAGRAGDVLFVPGAAAVFVGLVLVAVAAVRGKHELRPVHLRPMLELAATGLALWSVLFVESVLHPAQSVALVHAHQLLAFERPAGLAWCEHQLQAALLAVPQLWRVANGAYLGLHFLATPAIAWIAYRRGVWSSSRWELLAATVAALVVFAAWPVAPPWLVGGYVDTMPTAHPLGSAVGLDMLAAFPSVHVVWAAWAASTLRRSGSSSRVWIYPALVAVVVVSTGNHYLADVVGGLVLVVVTRGVARHAHRHALHRVAGVDRLAGLPACASKAA